MSRHVHLEDAKPPSLKRSGSGNGSGVDLLFFTRDKYVVIFPRSQYSATRFLTQRQAEPHFTATRLDSQSCIIVVPHRRIYAKVGNDVLVLKNGAYLKLLTKSLLET